MIFLNGEPYLKYNIRSLYPHAHQIIISEGACLGAKEIATKNGHSTDGTLDVLKEMQKNEDPEKKILVVTAEDEGHPNGFWPGEKLEQSRAYAKRATGNYLWQVDSDEFYKEKDILKVKQMLRRDPSITAISFIQLQFWGGFKYLVDSYYHRRGGAQLYRLFKWGDDYEYKLHRPPTILDDQGCNTLHQNWVRGRKIARQDIYVYHYSFVFPKQVFEKARYYQNAKWTDRKKADWWAEHIYMNLEDPFKVFSLYDTLSWLKRYKGSHPKQIENLRTDIRSGNLNIETRPTDDIEELLNGPFYHLKIIYFKCLIIPSQIVRLIRKALMKLSWILYSRKAVNR